MHVTYKITCSVDQQMYIAVKRVIR